MSAVQSAYLPQPHVHRHCLGGLVKERSATKLEAVMSLDRCHPHSGHQTWTPKEIHHQPQVMSMSITCRTVLKLILENADETSSQLLVSAVVDVKPQRIHLSTEAEGAKEPKPPSRNQKRFAFASCAYSLGKQGVLLPVRDERVGTEVKPGMSTRSGKNLITWWRRRTTSTTRPSNRRTEAVRKTYARAIECVPI